MPEKPLQGTLHLHSDKRLVTQVRQPQMLPLQKRVLLRQHDNKTVVVPGNHMKDAGLHRSRDHPDISGSSLNRVKNFDAGIFLKNDFNARMRRNEPRQHFRQ